MWWIGLIAGIGLVLFGAWKRWKVESATDGKGPGFMWPDLLMLAGLIAASRAVQHEIAEETGLEWFAAGLLGLGLVVAGLKMRPSGVKIVWSWGDGPVKNSSRVGKFLFLLGAMYVLCGVVGAIHGVGFG